MNNAMRLGDYLDLEWFLERDRLIGLREVQARDRSYGIEADKQGVPGHRVVPFWLERRRAGEVDLLPSSLWRGAGSLAAWVVALCGLLAGLSLVRGLLQYFGTYPVNVSVFLLFAVAPQGVLSLLAGGMLLIRRRTRRPMAMPWLSGLSFFPIRFRSSLTPQVGFIRTLLARGRYAPFVVWETLTFLHLGGMCFALGTVIGMLVSVAVTDLAFGWQSTLASGAHGMHLVVSGLSLPWSWLPASWGLVPSVEQIEGSRIVLKDGISSLASVNLAAWWPFLSMCLLCYGLLPRCVLYVVARKCLHRVEERFVHPDAARIADRMRAPVLDGEARPEPVSASLPLTEHEAGPVDFPGTAPRAESLAAVWCVLIMPPELSGRIAREDLARLVSEVSGYPLGEIVSAGLEPEELQDVLRECSRFEWMGGHQRFVFMVEAWQPPIREGLAALAGLGRDGSGNRSLFVLLVGRPRSGCWLTAPSSTDEKVWREAIDRLAPMRVDVSSVTAKEMP